jgi:hypothetical protein
MPSRNLRAEPWATIIRHLRDKKDRILIEALSTPLALWLLRQVYIRTQGNPEVLLDRIQFPNPDSIRLHLLDEVIPAVLSVNRPGSADDSNPFRPRREWSSDNVHKGLAYLAHSFSGRDIAWWHLRDTSSSRALIVAKGAIYGAIIVVAMCLAFGLGHWSVRGVAVAAASGVSYFIALLLQASITSGTRGKQSLALVILLSDIVFAGMFVLVFEFVKTPYSTLGVITITVLSGITMGIAYWFDRQANPAYVNFRIRARPRSLRLAFNEAQKEAGLGIGIAGFIITIVILAPTIGFGGGLTLVDTIATVLVSALCAGLVTWGIFVFAAGLLDWVQIPVATDRPGNPRGTLRGDLLLGLFRCLLIGAPAAIFIILLAFYGADIKVVIFNSIAFGLLFGLIAGLSGQGYAYLICKVHLSVKGSLPWRLMDFLEDSHRLGLLRQVGPIYQFRHAGLQDRLATYYDRISK